MLDPAIHMQAMTWTEYRRRIVEEDPIVIVPVGAVEQHGPHLPTGTDTLIPPGLQRAPPQGSAITAPRQEQFSRAERASEGDCDHR